MYNVKYCGLQAANMFVTTILSVFLIPLLESQDFDSFEIGILIAVKCVGMIVFSNIYAILADKYVKYISNKEFIEFFCISGIAITLLHIYIPMNMFRAVMIFIGYGATFSCICTFTDSLSSQYNSAGIKINYVMARSIGSLFYAVAGVVLGLITSIFKPDAILWLQVGALFICFIATIIMPNPNVAKDSDSKKVIDTSTLLQMFVNNPFYSVFLLSSFLFMTGVNITMSYMAYSVERAGGNNMQLGIASFLLGICEVFVALYFDKFLKRLGIRKLILLAMIGMGLRVFVLVIATNIILVYVAQLFELIGCMLWGGNIILVQEEILEENKVKGITLISAVQTGISVLSASLIGGYIMDKYNNAFYLNLCAFAFVVVGIAVYILDISEINYKEKAKKIYKILANFDKLYDKHG